MITNDEWYNSFIENNGHNEHNHTVDTIQKIDRQVLRENCIRKTTDSISTRPIKIIKGELTKNVSTSLEHKDIKSVWKAMYIERRKYFPPFATSFVEEIITNIIK